MSSPILRVALSHLIQARQAAWAGSGFGGTLLPPEVTLTPGAASRFDGPLHGWDRYIQLVALAYRQAPAKTGEGVKSFISLKEHILAMFTRIQSKVRVEFVDADPYSSAEDMQQKVRESGVLQISSQFNQSEAFGPEVNLMLRAVHDFTAHLGSNAKSKPRSFSFKGELQSYNKHLALVGAQSKAAGALFTEIVAQVCHFWYFGDFPSQKIATLPMFSWSRLGEVRGYRIQNMDLVG